MLLPWIILGFRNYLSLPCTPPFLPRSPLPNHFRPDCRLFLSNQYLHCHGTAATTVFIGVALWERPSITVFLWPPLSARDNRAVLNQQSNSPEKIPPEIATWIPPWGLIAATEKTSSNGGDLGALRTYQNVTLTRALAFVRIEGKLGRLALVAATADGMIAVAEWQSDGKSEEGWGREGKVWGDRGKLLTLASFQVGEGPVRLEVFDGSAEKATRGNNQFEYHPNLSRGQEAVFVNGGMDAVLHRCSNTDECPDPNQGIWQCTQVCCEGTQYSSGLQRILVMHEIQIDKTFSCALDILGCLSPLHKP